MSEHEKRLSRILGDINRVAGTDVKGKIDHSNRGINGWVNGKDEMTVTAGAMEQLDDDEVAVLIGHEVGHAVGKHCERHARLNKLEVGAIEQVLRDKSSGVIKKVIKTGALLGFGAVAKKTLSRGWERRADSVGSDLAQKAGYDPAAATSFFRKIDAEGSIGGGLLDSHPATSERAETAREKYGERQQPESGSGSEESSCSGCWCEDCGGGQCEACEDGDNYREHPCCDCEADDCEGCENVVHLDGNNEDQDSCSGCFCDDCSGGKQCEECDGCSNYRLDPDFEGEGDDEDGDE